MIFERPDLAPHGLEGAIPAGAYDLRPVRPSDTGLIALYTGDLRVAQATSSIPHPLPPGTTEAFIARVMAPGSIEKAWTIDGTRAGMGEVMGVISLTELDIGQCEIGYWVAPVFWNAGVASSAVGALIAANPLACRTIFATVQQGNPASARVLTNCGFTYLGDAESYCLARGGTVPTWTYSRKLD
ncbi:Protein N-acetyltransferase, RimJ/RimL family [Roseovarius nanhaiticus]|uniref:Protein N-acetyltransferase, RimJ/RimL family n=1 Tax=Roseovarius nanhaiticus TaxID=573024 RepID=A0A1N7HH04_9RHOB|nr:GNAT family protein [Roseovarius nanhaiticus]SEK95041.1 Protein N-acetyltransferase, RimJ/RimL family [Roseovarius nanhaiticus]SIS24082.1 Protein N-acetyltransferase, RimJ/RimL family [Roseovarius nanhaiticus]